MIFVFFSSKIAGGEPVMMKVGIRGQNNV